MPPEASPSICRLCLAYCPISVTVEDGKVSKVAGDPSGTPYQGYTCPKGRALPDQHNDPARLLHALKRQPDGSYAAISSVDAVDDIAGQLRRILDRDGSRSIAYYSGTGPVSNPTGQMLGMSFFQAIKSRNIFSAATIDKPAANTSTALHGNWMAGAQPFESADCWMIIGANPVISNSNGAPANNPAKRLKEAVARGMQLIVIDPRRTETARRAHIHLQARPGEDPAILAGLIRIILEEKLHDAAFVAENAVGLEALEAAVAPFTPDYVAARAGISAEDLILAARTFGNGKVGGAVCSTGPSFSTRSNLSYYLALCLNTICGRWGRAGDLAAYPNILLPPFTPRAQPYPPYPVFGKRPMRVMGLHQNASGLPTAALADEILTPGEGQIKVLFCVGGNPLLAWPDQAKAQAAMDALDLLVVFDYKMTLTARSAHYVVPPPLSLEIPGATNRVEALKYIGVSRGFSIPWAHYTPKVVDPPAGSDLIDDGAFFFRLAQALELQLQWTNSSGYGPHVEVPPERTMLDMSQVPTIDSLISLWCKGSRIPLETVKQYPHGRVFDEVSVIIAPREAACTNMLELGAPLMMDELAGVASDEVIAQQSEFPYRLICRRMNEFMNSVGQTLPALHRGKRYNPVKVHPEAMHDLGIEPGDLLEIRSAHGTVVAVAEGDDTLRRETISLAHGFGNHRGDETGDPRGDGNSVTQLIGLDEYDSITGMPRLSAVPVALVRVANQPEGIASAEASSHFTTASVPAGGPRERVARPDQAVM